MAGEIERIQIRVDAQTGDAQRELRRIGTQLDRTATSGTRSFSALNRATQASRAAFASLGTAIAASFLPLLTVQGLISGISSVTQAFGVQERAVNSLNAALQASGTFSQEASAAIQREASRIQSLTTAGDEQLLQAVSSIAQLTDLDDQGLVDVQRAIVGIAETFTGGNLESAALLIGKSISSSTNALSRYGIELDVSATQQERLGAILQQSERFFSVAQANAETLTGRHQQLSNASGDLQEQIGSLVVQAFDLQGVFEGLIEQSQSLGGALQENEQSIVGGIRSFIAFGRAIFRVGQEIARIVAPVEAVFGAAIDSINATTQAVQTSVRTISRSLSGLINFVSEIANRFNIELPESINNSASSINSALGNIGQNIAGALQETRLGGIFQDLQRDLQGANNLDVTTTVRRGRAPRPPRSPRAPGGARAGSRESTEGQGRRLEQQRQQLATIEQTNRTLADTLAIDRELTAERVRQLQLGTDGRISEQLTLNNELKQAELDLERSSIELRQQTGQITERQAQIELQRIDAQQREFQNQERLAGLQREREELTRQETLLEAEKTAEIERALVPLSRQLEAARANQASQQIINALVQQQALVEEQVNASYAVREEQLRLQLENLGLQEETIGRIIETTNQLAEAQNAVNANSQQTNESAQGLEETLQQAGQALTNSLTQALQDGRFEFEDFASSILDIFSNLANQIASQLINVAFAGLGGGGGGGGFLSNLFGGFRASAGGPVRAATGGYISGSGTSTSDSIPALLSNGEYVVNAASTRKYGGLIQAINQNKLPGFQAGGIVSRLGGGSSAASSLRPMGERTETTPVVVNYNINAIDSRSMVQALQQEDTRTFLEQNALSSVQTMSNRAFQRSTFERR